MYIYIWGYAYLYIGKIAKNKHHQEICDEKSAKSKLEIYFM